MISSMPSGCCPLDGHVDVWCPSDGAKLFQCSLQQTGCVPSSRMQSLTQRHKVSYSLCRSSSLCASKQLAPCGTAVTLPRCCVSWLSRVPCPSGNLSTQLLTRSSPRVAQTIYPMLRNADNWLTLSPIAGVERALSLVRCGYFAR